MNTHLYLIAALVFGVWLELLFISMQLRQILDAMP